MSRPAKLDMPVVSPRGKGTRLREETEYRPMHGGDRPEAIFWHIMKSDGAHGLDRFSFAWATRVGRSKSSTSCATRNDGDFMVTMDGSQPLTVHNQDGFESWRVTRAETGAETATGARLWRLCRYLDAETFCFTEHRRRGQRRRPRPAGFPLVAGAHRHRHRRPSHLALRRNPD